MGISKGEKKDVKLNNSWKIPKTWKKYGHPNIWSSKGPKKIQQQKSKISIGHCGQILQVKVKQRILKTEREKHQVAHGGKPIKITEDFSTETIQAEI